MIKLPDKDVPLFIVPKEGQTGQIFLRHCNAPLPLQGVSNSLAAFSYYTLCYTLQTFRKDNDKIQLYVLDGCKEAVLNIIIGLNDGK
jgi:hypothetical protein